MEAQVLDAKEMIQDKIIEESMEKYGHEDVRIEFWDVFRQGDDKRYVVGYHRVKYSDLVSDQVGVNALDKKRAKEEVAEDIKKNNNILKWPIFVKRTSSGKYKIVTGHHRAFAEDFLGNDIAVYELSDFENPTGIVSVSSERKARIAGNKPSKTKQYSMKDAVKELLEALADDPTLDGKNPNGTLPTRTCNQGGYDFDQFIEDFFPDWFSSSATRTKIYNRCKLGNNNTQIIEIDKSDITSDLTNLQWDSGLNTHGRASANSRKKFTEHFDIQNKALILVADSNGNNAKGKLLDLLEALHLDLGYKNKITRYGIDKIFVHARIYDPQDTISNVNVLNYKRDEFTEEMKRMNRLLKSTNTLMRIDRIAYIKQNNSTRDSGRIDQIQQIVVDTNNKI
jgi:hypothetical protein